MKLVHKKYTCNWIAVLMMLYVVSTPVVATPSTNLVSILDTKLSAISKDHGTMPNKIQALVSNACEANGNLLCILVEYVEKNPVPSLKNEDVPEGTLNQQLDWICQATGYVWRADGDWVNLIPKDKVDDPNYVMNQRIPGTVVISRDPTKSTPVKTWFTDHGISTARDYRGLRISGAVKERGPDPIVLQNPTLREYANALETHYGNNIATRKIGTCASDVTKGSCIILTSWGQSTKPLVLK